MALVNSSTWVGVAESRVSISPSCVERPGGSPLCSVCAENPTCGDAVKLEAPVEPDGTLGAVRFDAKGCAISTASASLMTERLSGRPLAEARADAERFIAGMRGEAEAGTLDEWDDLACLKGVIRYPLRVKCATLAWHALLEALAEAEVEAEARVRGGGDFRAD